MNTLPNPYTPPYTIDPKYSKSAVYFSMEFAIDQALKIYSGGLGFLAGSHMRSAYDLNQNLMGIGILWKYGYYDQERNEDKTLRPAFQEKVYHFLKDTGIKFQITISGHPVWVTAYYLDPKTFGTCPMFLLSTDLEENDYLSKATSFRLYDSDPKGKIAQSMLLGLGGAKLLDELGYDPEIYHLNEAHALSAAFHVYQKTKSKEAVKEKFVFTTHTPEAAGNEKHDIELLHQMGFFNGLSMDEVRSLTGIEGREFDHSLAALRISHLANGVSKLHGEVSRRIWKDAKDICPIIHITNAQNKRYWVDIYLEEAKIKHDLGALQARKKRLKQKLFKEVADQTGKLFDPNVLTIVWARRFAEYKRADLLTRDAERFHKIINNADRPVQVIWAGKPYPMDYNAISTFNSLVFKSKEEKNMAVLTGYELALSKLMKDGSDVWLNNPRVTREASGTSGMTAAMNGAINFSTYDGWICEFTPEQGSENSFVIPSVDHTLPHYEQDEKDLNSMLDILENQIIPLYYDNHEGWNQKVLKSMNDVSPYFDSNRMADEYYEKLYV